MARRPRGDEPGAWFHVINRGIAKRALFESRSEARFFLSRLARQVRAGRIEVHAFCLMTTHYHLLLRSPIGELSEAMRLAQSSYSRHFNRKHKRDGSLIRGRYYSRPVDSLEYRRTLVRYIDHNPVKAGLVSHAHAYELSSAALHMAARNTPWLSSSWIREEACRVAEQTRFTPSAYIAAFGAGYSKEMLETQELVQARMNSTALPNPKYDLIGTSSRQVRAWMQRKAKLADGHRVGLPICSSAALLDSLKANLATQGPWWVETKNHNWRGDELIWISALHDLCGLTWKQISERIDKPIALARRRASKHNELMLADSEYGDRAQRVVCAALQPIGRRDRSGTR
ncbi:MAG: transposase [Planctomycetota bacterium]|nr:transposase [Planctomycetota bacterium]